MAELETFFTADTDYASTMSCILNAVNLQIRVSYGRCWVGCIGHQPNSAMRRATSSSAISSGIIGRDSKAVKTVVTLFKRALLNFNLLPGFALVQEIEIRFETVFDETARFNKLIPYLSSTILKPEFDYARKVLHLLDTLTISLDANGVPREDALDAISVAFKHIRHVQTALEASNHITTIKLIPLPNDVKAPLRLVSSCVIHSETMIVPSLSERELATVTLSAIDNIAYQDHWAASLVIHPGLCGLSELILARWTHNN